MGIGVSCLPRSTDWISYSVTLLEFKQSDFPGNTEEGIISLSLVDNGSPGECRRVGNLGV